MLLISHIENIFYPQERAYISDRCHRAGDVKKM